MRSRTLSPPSACFHSSLPLSGVVPSIFHCPFGRSLARGGRTPPARAPGTAVAGAVAPRLGTGASLQRGRWGAGGGRWGWGGGGGGGGGLVLGHGGVPSAVSMVCGSGRCAQVRRCGMTVLLL